MICDGCKLPTSNQSSYWCPGLGCMMYPHYCRDYQTKPHYQRAWDEGRGPGQPQPLRIITARANRPPMPQGGPGTELSKILSRFGIHPSECGCKAHAREMDRRGPEWCGDNIERIVGWLSDEATKRKWRLVGVSRPATRVLVRWAIRRSEATA